MVPLYLLSPFEQFSIFIIGTTLFENIIITNYILYAFICLGLITLLFVIVPNLFPFKFFSSYGWQSILERLYLFVFDFINQQVGLIAQKFLPLFFNLFVFILVANFVGLVPFSFTLTSHIMLTFMLSFSVFMGLTLYAIHYQPNFFELFIPQGVPGALKPFLFVIELISYVSRTFSLAIRLFANMMSGHVLLYILTGFCAFLVSDFSSIGGHFIAVIPFILITAILVLEIGIAFLQAYVFCILVSIYLGDVYRVGH
jgi:ATP synthase subunit 6